MNNISPRSALSFVLATALAGCFPTPSQQYSCTSDEQCSGGRTCDTDIGFCVTGDGGTGDGSGSDDAADACMSFMPRHFMGCSIPKPMAGAVTLGAGNWTFDTSNGQLIDPSAAVTTPATMMVNDYRVISVESFSVGMGAVLRVKGPVPLVIASWSTIDVAGTIDVSSKEGLPGAGAQPFATPSTFCATRISATLPENGQGGGGGGGGAMQSDGGNGGGGNNNNDTGGLHATGAGATPPLLAAGCPGQTGGTGNINGNTVPGGPGGLGGGAIQLTAKTSISIASTARIHAGGAGGRPGGGGVGGGGGGGAGGMIGLEAPALGLMTGAILAANGGAGGQGGGNANGNAPDPGQDGQLSVTAATCQNRGSGGDGGSGSVSLTAGVGGSADGAGGGGAGGGAGYIVFKGTRTGDATYSPASPIVQ